MNGNMIINDRRENIINNLINFMSEFRNRGEVYEDLEEIIEMHFKYDSKQNLIRNLVQHITEKLQINIFGFLDYLKYNEYVYMEYIGINIEKYTDDLDKINKIKLKYGIFIRELTQKSQEPFIINSVETNINQGSSLHTIKCTRADGETLVAQFSSEILMAIITSLTNSLKISMQAGVYNLNESTINNYINESKSFNSFIDQIVSKNKNEQEYKEIAVSKEGAN